MLYLSPVLDGFNSEIIAYNLSTSPNLAQVKAMLEQTFTEKYYENTILHSDQGYKIKLSASAKRRWLSLCSSLIALDSSLASQRGVSITYHYP